MAQGSRLSVEDQRAVQAPGLHSPSDDCQSLTVEPKGETFRVLRDGARDAEDPRRVRLVEYDHSNLLISPRRIPVRKAHSMKSRTSASSICSSNALTSATVKKPVGVFSTANIGIVGNEVGR